MNYIEIINLVEYFSITISNKFKFKNSKSIQFLSLNLERGKIYSFPLHLDHEFAISETKDGIHSGGTDYTTGVSKDEHYLYFTVPQNAPDRLYFYCKNNPNMGGEISIIHSKPYNLERRQIYEFLNQNFDFAISEKKNGIHSGGTEYTTGIVRDNNSLYFTVPNNAPDKLYLYCKNNVNVGSEISIRTTDTSIVLGSPKLFLLNSKISQMHLKLVSPYIKFLSHKNIITLISSLSNKKILSRDFFNNYLIDLYKELTSYNAKERFIFLQNGWSGYFITRSGGARVTNQRNMAIFSLNNGVIYENEFVENVYRMIVYKCNVLLNINNFNMEDIKGQVYFLRAYCNFVIATLFLNKTDSIQLYNLIIDDCKTAKKLIGKYGYNNINVNSNSGSDLVSKYAANMLLAKAYVFLACQNLQDKDYWKLASVELLEIVNSGNYSLVDDYSTLFNSSNNNNSESIFQLEVTEEKKNGQSGRNFTPWKYKKGSHFGWLSVTAFCHDYLYPNANQVNDNRYQSTFLSKYTRADNGRDVRIYPTMTSRHSFNSAHPYFFKFAEKDKNHDSQYNGQNFIIFRYAEVLLMLAECYAEIDKLELSKYYLNKILKRCGLTLEHRNISTKENLIDTIMDEYKYELLGEGSDVYHNRRRGFEYFKKYIDLHNSWEKNNDYDLVLNDSEEIMEKINNPLWVKLIHERK